MKKGLNEKPKWQKTPVPNLYKNRDSGRYYFRASITQNGKRKEIWKSLKTSVLTVAKLRLLDKQAEVEHRRQTDSTLDGKEITLGQLGRIYSERVRDQDLEPKSKDARLGALKRLERTWPGLSDLPVSNISVRDCERWANAFREDACGLAPKKTGKKPGASTFNTTIDCLRRLCEIALKNGFVYRDPTAGLPKKRPPRKDLRFPACSEFRDFLALIEANPKAPRAADTVTLLAYSGLRLGEAMALKWRDVDFERGLLHAPGTKSEAARRVLPLFPPLQTHLDRMYAKYNPTPEDPVLVVRDCQRSMDAAAKKLGIRRMVHHDLRHFFISNCIEAGIDFLTISRWVGHADGGVLISKTYGHLRQEYSLQVAKRVTFGEEAPADNVVKMEVSSDG